MSYVALIPLRGGSKGIPGKNIKPMAGKPLCRWALEAAAGASRLERVFAATDSEEIASLIRGFGLPKLEVIGRSPATATDAASTESVLLEFAEKREFGHLVLIQATSPLVTARDLDEAIGTLERQQADSLVSVVPQKRFTWSLRDDGSALPTNYEPASRPRRQDFSPHYVENGAIYVSERRGLLEHQCRLFGRMAAYVMAEETFHELDEPADWTLIEALLARRETSSARSAAERAKGIKLVLTDVDGVLTDSGMYYSEQGDELKKFNTRDGKAFELLREAGIRTGIITAENTKLVERRARKIKADFLVQGASDKLAAFQQVLSESGLRAEEVAYVGDDLGDIDLLRAVGLSACPADASEAVRSIATYVCARRGGEGCVRELAELILAAAQNWK